MLLDNLTLRKEALSVDLVRAILIWVTLPCATIYGATAILPGIGPIFAPLSRASGRRVRPYLLLVRRSPEMCIGPVVSALRVFTGRKTDAPSEDGIGPPYEVGAVSLQILGAAINMGGNRQDTTTGASGPSRTTVTWSL